MKKIWQRQRRDEAEATMCSILSRLLCDLVPAWKSTRGPAGSAQRVCPKSDPIPLMQTADDDRGQDRLLPQSPMTKLLRTGEPFGPGGSEGLMGLKGFRNRGKCRAFSALSDALDVARYRPDSTNTNPARVLSFSQPPIIVLYCVIRASHPLIHNNLIIPQLMQQIQRTPRGTGD
ncbi:hypothetical protein BDK51DRAFT_52775 [Blyttiomyces helicus]|uniref:Uncharacterized protein n=1 Tax=Blyttiomyces helicus TaxID=388810 RepID=A0A4P9W0D8_9FUNG|nr:hypothetical protein BDK51DRAFT_52775 [Blyttiomyces helicus]|eukprot:RKO85601.1 hypothetical protein BDK51DRAFT_52775 [Blyttiomyces helicus]